MTDLTNPGAIAPERYSRMLTAAPAVSYTFTLSTSAKAVAAIGTYWNSSGVVTAKKQANNTAGTSHGSDPIGTQFNGRVINVVGLDTVTGVGQPSGFSERVEAASPAGAPAATLEISDLFVQSPSPSATFTASSTAAATSAVVTLHLAGKSTSTLYRYGVDRQRVLRKDPGGRVTAFLGDGVELSKQSPASTVQATRFYDVAGVNVAVRTTSVLEWVLGDSLGSVAATVDYGSGNVKRHYYTPYGALRASTGGTATTEHGFLNQVLDTPTGLNYLNNRYHDPTTGTFLSVDPLVNKTGEPYLYGAGNPVTFSDPNGLEPGSWYNSGDEAWVYQTYLKKKEKSPRGIPNRVGGQPQRRVDEFRARLG